MSVLEAMVDALTAVAETAADLEAPRGVLVFINDMAPGKIPSNDSLSLLGKVRAAVDEGFQPVVVFGRSNPGDKYQRSTILKAIKDLAADSSGKVRVVTRGLERTPAEEGDFALWDNEIASDAPNQADFDQWEREIIPNEGLTHAISRAGMGLELPVVGVVVGFPFGSREAAGQLPQVLRKFFRRFDLPVGADYSHGAVRQANHSAIDGRSGIASDLELDAEVLANFDFVATPTKDLAKAVTKATNRHLKNTDGYAFTANYPLINEDGVLSIATMPIVSAGAILRGTSMDFRTAQGNALADALKVAPKAEGDFDAYLEPAQAFTPELGRGLGRQADYELGA